MCDKTKEIEVCPYCGFDDFIENHISNIKGYDFTRKCKRCNKEFLKPKKKTVGSDYKDLYEDVPI